jgi:hypothetical protein
VLANLKTYAQFEKTRIDLIQEQDASHSEGTGHEDDTSLKDNAVKWTLFLGNPATTTRTIRNTLWNANQEGLAQLFTDCDINTHIRVFDFEKPDEAALAVTCSVTPGLERIGYNQLLPSFAYPSALLRDFGSGEEIELMFDHIAKTYLSLKYRETRDWRGFVRRRSTAESVSRWMAKLSDIEGVSVPSHLEQMAGGSATSALQELFAEKQKEGEQPSAEILAKQVVDFLVPMCLDAFPEFFESLSLPRTAEELDRMTSYELAAAIFSRWDTEKDFLDELTVRTRSVLPEWKRDLLQFCARAILYMFNIRIRRKYRQLFISV